MEAAVIKKYKDNLSQEIYKDIPGYEGLYQVSNTGKIKSFHRKERLLKTHIDKKQGYSTVCLYTNSKGKTFRVHVLVAMTFLNHNPNGYEIVVDHIDNDPTNNHLTNLQLISNRENSTKDKTKGNYSSKYPCVSWNKQLQKWSARVRANGSRKFLGYFFNEIDAHRAVQNYLADI